MVSAEWARGSYVGWQGSDTVASRVWNVDHWSDFSCKLGAFETDSRESGSREVETARRRRRSRTARRREASMDRLEDRRAGPRGGPGGGGSASAARHQQTKKRQAGGKYGQRQDAAQP